MEKERGKTTCIGGRTKQGFRSISKKEKQFSQRKKKRDQKILSRRNSRTRASLRRLCESFESAEGRIEGVRKKNVDLMTRERTNVKLINRLRRDPEQTGDHVASQN